MKLIKTLGVIFVVCAAFSAIAATAAFAESEWLESGLPITVVKEALFEGEWTLSNTLFGVKTEIKCSYIYAGTVGPGATGSVTDVLSLASEEAVELEDTSKPIDCTIVNSGGCTSGSLAEVWPDNLSLTLGLTWVTKIELSGTAFLDDFPTNSGYEIKCTGFLGTIEALCEGLVTATLTNLATDVENKLEGTTSGEVACTVGEKGTLTASGLTFLESGLALQVS